MTAGSGASNLSVMTRPRAYLLAVIVTVVAVTATLPLQRTFDRFPYLPLLVAAVIISAWIGGLGPGLVAAAGGAIAAEYLVMGGLHAVGAYPDLLAQLAIVVAVAAIVTSIRGSRARASAMRRNRLLWELEERVKELTLLHHATSLLQEDKDVETLLRQFVELLPAGWQFPEMLEARITVANLVVSTPRFRVTPWIQRAEFPIHGAEPGLLEVVYLEAPSTEAGGQFLPEERSLMDSLASLLASYFERAHRMQERLELARAQASRMEAEAANRMKDAFLATVSHELRRPLTAMLGWTRMLRESNAGDTARALEVIERSANIQLRLIEELLDLSRAATGQLSVAFSLVNLNAIVRNVADAARPAAADGRWRSSRAVPRTTPRCWATKYGFSKSLETWWQMRSSSHPAAAASRSRWNGPVKRLALSSQIQASASTRDCCRRSSRGSGRQTHRRRRHERGWASVCPLCDASWSCMAVRSKRTAQVRVPVLA